MYSKGEKLELKLELEEKKSSETLGTPIKSSRRDRI